MTKTDAEKAAAKAAKDAEKAAAKADSVTVSWRGNDRVYSKEVHGDDFAERAAEFAAKVGGVVA